MKYFLAFCHWYFICSFFAFVFFLFSLFCLFFFLFLFCFWVFWGFCFHFCFCFLLGLCARAYVCVYVCFVLFFFFVCVCVCVFLFSYTWDEAAWLVFIWMNYVVPIMDDDHWLGQICWSCLTHSTVILIVCCYCLQFFCHLKSIQPIWF